MRFIKFILSSILFLLVFAAVILSVVLVSAGLLAIPASLAVITGIFTNVISDLSPVAMLFAGISCISAGLSVALAVAILVDKRYGLFGTRSAISKL
jgi:hypothetical protein